MNIPTTERLAQGLGALLSQIKTKNPELCFETQVLYATVCAELGRQIALGNVSEDVATIFLTSIQECVDLLEAEAA